MRSILTAASAESVKADTDIAAASHTTLVQRHMAETNWTWIWLLFCAGRCHWCATRCRAARSESFKLQHEEKALTVESDEEPPAKERDDRSRQDGREAVGIFMTENGFCNSGKYHNTVCSGLMGARVWKRLTLCSECS